MKNAHEKKLKSKEHEGQLNCEETEGNTKGTLKEHKKKQISKCFFSAEMVSLTVFGRTDLSALRQKIRRYVLALKHRGCAENNTRSSRFLNATVCRTLFQVNLFSFQNYQYRFFPHRLNCSH